MARPDARGPPAAHGQTRSISIRGANIKKASISEIAEPGEVPETVREPVAAVGVFKTTIVGSAVGAAVGSVVAVASTGLFKWLGNLICLVWNHLTIVVGWKP